MSWYHGTHSDHFDVWRVPPPQRSPLDIAHTAVFFTQDRDFAEAAGPQIASITLHKKAKIIKPALPGRRSASLRKQLINSSPLVAYCEWVSDNETWYSAWKTGEVMRFAIDQTSIAAVDALNQALDAAEHGLRELSRDQFPTEVISDLPQDAMRRAAMNNLTRSWIEQIVRTASEMEFHAVQGAEIDRWTN